MSQESRMGNSVTNGSKTSGPTSGYAMRSTSVDARHTNQSKNQVSLAIQNIKQRYENLKQNCDQIDMEKNLLFEINQWEKESIELIQSEARKAWNDLEERRQKINNFELSLTNELQNRFESKLNQNNIEDCDIDRCEELLDEWQRDLQQISRIKINKNNFSLSPLITFETTNEIEQTKNPARSRRTLSTSMTSIVSVQKKQYLSIYFGVTKTDHPQIYQLFEHLQSLPPMNKNGPTSGDCNFQTSQMEKFLSQTFDFQNIPGEYIVQGVKAFRLGKSIDSMPSNSMIRFPSKTTPATENSFVMSVEEIRQWQNSYAVYADQTQKGMTKEFLQLALQGQSKYGAEAFLMKFVVRISQCPILMEFDGKIIPRNYNERWPNNIKLVSVTGIDFAGRIHDVNDILTYVSNWRDVYEIDARSDLPQVHNRRDFRRRLNAPKGKLNKNRLGDDLKRMARLRFQAYDKEGVQIVVETGIGLGVFAGQSIGIDEKVREYSAYAIRKVLQEDGKSYRNIRAVVFALPIFEIAAENGPIQHTYQAFTDEFRHKYNGPIPVLIADQDMHHLTVAIARKNFKVSELNPADSHGVFGEYWQNRGPAVQEKVALTTVGLLVQHHLINPNVLDPSHYHLIEIKT